MKQQVEEVLCESLPDYSALLPLASAATEAIGRALAEAPSCSVPASAVAGLAGALGASAGDEEQQETSLLSRLRFAPPTSASAVRLTGSAPLRAALPGSSSSSLLLLDVAVEMPRAVFDEKDFKRGRYLVRRAAWLQGAKAALEKAVLKAEKKKEKKKKESERGKISPLRGAALSWTDLGGDARKPCLLVSLPLLLPLPSSSSGKVSLRLVPAPPLELARAWLPRLAPDRGNLGGGGGGGASPPPPAPPSPRYNALLVADFFPDAEARDLELALGHCPAVADGVTLIRLWARAQRLSSPSASDDEDDGGGGEDLAAAPLLSSRALAAAAASAAAAGRLARPMSALQAARAIWKEVEAAAGRGASPRFAESWETSPGGEKKGAGGASSLLPSATVLSSPSLLPLPRASYPQPPPVSSFVKSGTELVVLSCGGHLNLAAAAASPSATAAAGRRVAAVAAAAITALDAARAPGGDPEGCVDALWLRRRVAPWLGDYDAFWRVRVPLSEAGGGGRDASGNEGGDGKTSAAAAAAATPASSSSVFSASAAPLAGDLPVLSAQESRIESIARAALGGRVTEVRAVPRRRLRSDPEEGPAAAPTAATSTSAAAGNAFSSITLAGRANPAAFSRRADVGPPADSGRAAAAFRAFWGELSDLRRFGDGAIREAVVWGSQKHSLSSPAAAADSALAAAMRRHAEPGATVVGLTDSLEPALAERGGGGGGGGGTRGSGGGGGSGIGAFEQQQRQQRQQSRSQDALLSSSAALDAALSKLSKALRGLPGASGGGGEEANGNGECCGVALRPVGVAATSSFLGRRTAPFPPSPHPLLLALQQQQHWQQQESAASSRGRKGGGSGSGSGGVAGGGAASFPPSSSSPSAVIPRTLPAVEVAVQLEGSGRWPQDACAASKMKAALACQIAERLEGDYGFWARAFEVDASEGASSAVGCGAALEESFDSGGRGGGGGGFNVFVDGFAFRCLLWSPRDDAAVTAAKARERTAARAAAARAVAAAKSNVVLAPPPTTTTPADAAALRSYSCLRARIDHSAALAAVAGVNPGFSRGGRLLVRWAGAHLLLSPPSPPATAATLSRAKAAAAPSMIPVPALELVAAAASGPRLAGGSGSGLCPPPNASASRGGGGGGGPSSSAAEEEPLLQPRAAVAVGDAAAPPSTALAVFAASLRLLSERGQHLSAAPGGEVAHCSLPLIIDPLGQMEPSQRARALRGEAGDDEEEDFAALSRRRRQQLSQRKEEQKAFSSTSPLPLASAVDPSGALWTRRVDPATVLRLSRLARRALEGMEAALLSGGGGGAERSNGSGDLDDARPPSSLSLLEAAFAPALADWDALIWLKPSALPAGGRRAPPRPAAPPAAPPGRPGRLPADGSAGRCGAAIASLPLRGGGSGGGGSACANLDELLVGFDPIACFVRSLAHRFGAVASFGCDGAGGESPVVGVRWLKAAKKAWPPGAGPLMQTATAPTSVVAAASRSSGSKYSSSSSLPLVLSVELDEETTLAAMCAAGGGIADGFSVVRQVKKKKEKSKRGDDDDDNDDDDDDDDGDGDEEEEGKEKEKSRRASKARRRL